MSGPGLNAFRLASLALADVIDAHDFGLRERLVLGLIRRQSFGKGRFEAYFPADESSQARDRWRFFRRACGMSLGNASEIVRGLIRKQVVDEGPEFYFGFRLPVGDWKVPLRSEEVEVIRQLELLDKPPLLNGALRVTFVEQFAEGQAATVFAALNKPATEQPALRRAALPESGSAAGEDRFPNREGNGLSAAAAPSAFPDSGSGTLQQCKLVPSGGSLKEQIYNVATVAVPESGRIPETAEASVPRERAGRFDPERQELFDRLGDVGAFGAGNRSRGFWFSMVQHRPEVVKQLLGEYEWAVRKQTPMASPGQFMNDKWQRWGRPDK